MRFQCRGFLFAAVIGALTVMLAPSGASAWVFDDTCAPRTSHNTSAAEPAVYTILDRSGSMTATSGYDLTGDGSEEDRWEASEIVINDVASATHRSGTCNPPTDRSGCDTIRFGLGYFGDTADAGVTPGEDTMGAISTSLDNTGLQTDTYTGMAADLIADSPALDDASRPSIGVIITDGIAEDEETMEHAINRLCEVRERGTSPIQTYVVGFSGDADQALNSILAAAGGTGQCCYGGSATCDSADRFDPCSISASELDSIIKDYDCCENSTYIASGHTCSGSKEASDPAALKDELLAITGTAACTFPLDVPGDYPSPGALDDPGATDVTMYHDIYGTIRVPYFDPSQSNSGSTLDDALRSSGVPSSEADKFDDDGFFFTNGDRDFVQLTEDLCGDIKSDRVERVETQLACPCENGGEPCEIAGNEGRCAQGVISCVTGSEECLTQYRPMPEICNGLDDDCDGTVDDLHQNETEWSGSQWDLPDGHEPLYCYYRNVCRCPEGASDAYGDQAVNVLNGATQSEEFDAFLDTWTGACTFGAGLSTDASAADFTPAPSATAGPSQPDGPSTTSDGAACSVVDRRAGQSGAGMAFLLALAALVGIRLRRLRE